MTQISKHFMAPKIEEKVYRVFINSVKNTKSSDEVIDYLNDLLTPVEKIMLAKRVAVAFLLLEGKYTYDDISKNLKVSRGTIAKVHAVLILQGKGYRKILGDMLRRKALRSVLAELLEGLTPLPSKGANWARWKKSRKESERKRGESL